MNDINQIILVGNVGKVETKMAGAQGQYACNFSVATKHSWKDKSGQWKDETTWHNCVKWLKHETDAPQKGDRVFVEGSLSTRDYLDKEGNKKYVTEIKVKSFFTAPKDSMSPLPIAPTFDKSGAFNEDSIPF